MEVIGTVTLAKLTSTKRAFVVDLISCNIG